MYQYVKRSIFDTGFKAMPTGMVLGGAFLVYFPKLPSCEYPHNQCNVFLVAPEKCPTSISRVFGMFLSPTPVRRGLHHKHRCNVRVGSYACTIVRGIVWHLTEALDRLTPSSSTCMLWYKTAITSWSKDEWHTICLSFKTLVFVCCQSA